MAGKCWMILVRTIREFLTAEDVTINHHSVLACPAICLSCSISNLLKGWYGERFFFFNGEISKPLFKRFERIVSIEQVKSIAGHTIQQDITTRIPDGHKVLALKADDQRLRNLVMPLVTNVSVVLKVHCVGVVAIGLDYLYYLFKEKITRILVMVC